MTKKRVGIYIDAGVWDSVKESAWKRRESVSSYLEKLILKGRKGFTDEPRVERIARGDMVGPRNDDEVIGEAQARLDSVRQRYKEANPKKICPVCQKFNKDCECK